MIIGNAAEWGNWQTVALSVVLAFVFGYSFTLLPLLKAKIAVGTALGLAFASDTLSITIMEIIDNALMTIIPGAMDAELTSPLFWGSMAGSLVVAGAAAFPVNRRLIARNRGHALIHGHHETHMAAATNQSDDKGPADTRRTPHAHSHSENTQH